MTTFRDLKVGDTFDFVGDDRLYNSFFHRCTKTSARGYSWEQDGQKLKSTVGTIGVEVFHVEPAKG